jgi:hypothetical protein
MTLAPFFLRGYAPGRDVEPNVPTDPRSLVIQQKRRENATIRILLRAMGDITRASSSTLTSDAQLSA